MSKYNTVLDIVEKGLFPEKTLLENVIDNVKNLPDNEYVQKSLGIINKYPKTSAGIGGALGGYSINELLNDEENLSEDELLMEILANSK